MFFGLFGTKADPTPEAIFWKWFAANEAQLFSWEVDRDTVFDRLSSAMSKVHPDLTFEFGPVTEGKREFVISAGGLKPAFPAVEALFACAPPLQRWSWVKFRPRRAHLHDIEFGGKLVRADDVHFLLAHDDSKLGILLFFAGYNISESSVFGQIGYLFLDEALGEYAVEMQVGFIEFHSRESEHFAQACSLRALPATFHEAWAARVH